MMKSMTAYARASRTEGELTADVEIRTYNSRHLDPMIRVPSGMNGLEERIKAMLASRLARGRVEVRLQISDMQQAMDAFEVDMARAASCKSALECLARTLDIPGEVSLGMILDAGTGILRTAEKTVDPERLLPVVETVMGEALDSIDAMRCTEGRYLADDFRRRLDWIEEQVNAIETASEDLVTLYRNRLMERVSLLLQDAGLEADPGRLLQEAAILADRSDISEEVVRARSHILHFRDIMDGSEPGGRKLNFLLQEFNREFNTMGSKAGDSSVAHRVVAVKAELEKLREQVQNIE
ncbi:YicC family protein [Desulfobotulus sp. H1]|uniref:YicC family protein n=1 Tax=Desulfobotulus pelophilus TaxID=2823377 RepID=A0ABT3N9P1_9BACT|nr:YicC/YloC family endoribonuclease [Desulfobotulus pelophilus]MCW7754182.1 YicC family protein [Desulfobotulus pelophilus]